MKEFFGSMLPTAYERLTLGIGGVIGWVWGFCFGTCGQEAVWLCIFIFADYLTGMYRAFYFGEYDSSIGCRGLIKKFFILCVCALAKGMDVVIGTETIQAFFIGAFCLNEMLSLLENIGQVHPNFVPPQVQHFLEKLKKRVGRDEDEA